MKQLHPPLIHLEKNELKTFIQEEIASLQDDNILAEAYTGFGKTNIGMIKIKKQLETNKDSKIIILVPKKHLEQSWKQQIEQKYLFSNIDICVINSYTFNQTIKNCDLLIIDEVQRVLNEESNYFSKAIELTNFKKSLFLSATLSQRHKDYLNLLLKLKNKEELVNYKISLYWGFKNNLTPMLKIFNIGVNLTLTEKNDYLKAHNTHIKYSSYFNKVDIKHPYNLIKAQQNEREKIALKLGITSKELYGSLMTWLKALENRKSIISKSSNKVLTLNEILTHVKEKTLIFLSSIDSLNQVDSLGYATCKYHSKLKTKEKEENLKSFYNGEKPFLLSIESLKEGFNVEDCKLAIRVGYNSNELDAIQQIGRIIRLTENNDTEAIFINFYINDFIIGNNEIKSQEKVWLLNSLSKQNYQEITVEELIQYLNERYFISNC